MAALVFSLFAAPTARALELEMPIHCVPGEDCWVVNYVDIDPSGGVADYMCGRTSYDGHKGVDIAIIDAGRMRQGVPVFASAAGTVQGTRNDMKDIDFNQNGGRQSVDKKECGNGVVINHGDGWTTQYCHMKKGSIIVRKGDRVTTGRQLGEVGLSGLTEFPHIHMQVKRGDKVIDPFIGTDRAKECGVGENPLWNKAALADLTYQPTAIFNAGFSSTTPNKRFAREGLYGEEFLFESSPVMALWADMYWAKAGDKVTFLITGPDGKPVVGHTASIKKTSARRFVYAGLRRKEKGWATGTYTGKIELIRAGQDQVISVTRTIDVN